MQERELFREIGAVLADWYGRNRRDLPWRTTRDPYRIWLAEVILQQTRVIQGLSYYERFIALFPDINSLAAATEDRVLKLWQGLGYYSRARNLHAAAKEVAGRFGGRFPRTYAEVRSLPGVGDYTAAAVCSIAYELPCAVVDGNVYRVLARLFDVDLPIGSGEAKKAFAELAGALLDSVAPGVHNQALMEFGALYCTPLSPGCANCPLGDRCLARAHGTVAQRPVKVRKTAPKPRYFHYLHIRTGDKTLLQKRGAHDIWKNLYEFPLIETNAPADWFELQGTELFRTWFAGTESVTLRRSVGMPPHHLTHRTIHARFYEIILPETPPGLRGFIPVDDVALGDYAIPRLIERYLIDN